MAPLSRISRGSRLTCYRLITLASVVILTISLIDQSLTMEFPPNELVLNITLADDVNITTCQPLRCPSPNYNLCKCDDSCIEYEDCCWHGNGDFFSKSPTTDSIKQDGLKCIATTFQNFQFRLDVEKLILGFYMISECLPGVQNDQLIQKCHDSRDVLSMRLDSWNQYVDHLPVFASGTQKTYKNVHCARCNAVTYSQMRFWQLLVDENCDVTRSPDECDDLAFQAVYSEDTSNLRSCVQVDIDSCPSSANTDQTRTELCESYLAPVEVNGTVYRNPHCLLCNNQSYFEQDEEDYCPDLQASDPAGSSGRLPQSIPFDFSFTEEAHNETTVTFCAIGLTYNESSEVCELSENVTVVTTEHCLEPENYPFLVFLDIQPVDLNASQMFLNFSANSYHPVLTLYFYVMSLHEYPCDLDPDADNTTVLMPCATIAAEMSSIQNNSRITSKVIRDYFWTYGIRVLRLDITAECTAMGTVVSAPSSYTFLNVFNTSDVTLYMFEKTDYAIIHSQNRVYSDVRALVIFQYFSSDNFESFNEESWFNISLHQISREDLLCPFSVFLSEDYSVSTNGSLQSQFFEDEIPVSDYLILSNGQLKVCSRWIIETKPPGYNLFLLVIFIIFTSLSLIGLFLTFVNYCIFKSLRNLPGMITMNFVVALFFAQLVLIPSYVSPANIVLCTLISTVGHFLWLAAFLWMTIIAYDVTRTFGTSSLTRHGTSVKKQLLTYMLIGWLLPAAFVISCLILQKSTNLEGKFSYGEEGSCWLRPSLANFLLFGIPAAFCLCCNFIMYLVTVHGIRKAKQHTKMAKNMSTSNIMKEQLLLFIKISILIGLSWIWAFLSGFFPRVTAFLFIHTFVNPLQGVFVFLVYVCNGRVYSMWKAKSKKTYFTPSDTGKGDTRTMSTTLSDRGVIKAKRGTDSIMLEDKIELTHHS
ncbi:uncharacterized protein [Apostichopus japonicus]|uniref:uncharacterized protein n=1 Tax=Stichopus japonicus TaxID=307972 RepID=UPI003AB355E8